MRSLSFKMTLAFVVVAIVAVGIVGFIAYRVTASEFGAYLSHADMMNGMMGQNGSAVSRAMGQPEQAFLSAVTIALWVAGFGAGGLALILGFFFARKIVAPLRRLTVAAEGISQGNLAQRVEVKGQDEVGKLAEAFNQMAQDLSRNEEVRRNLLADIAHELRTPLTVVQGNLEGMLDGVVDPTPEHIASLHEEVSLLSRLVSDLRDLSLADAGQLHLQLVRANLAELVEKALARVQAQADEKGIGLKRDLPGNLPQASLDADRIGQVITNLLTNAVRHTPAGGEITVRVRKDEAAGAIRVSVVDTGSGIAPQDLPYVFDRFYRVDKSRARSSGGSGIGLAIVKQLVEAHHGRAWVESTPGKGSTFSFTLPSSA
jgi:signal transduction histidine kinase